MKILSKENLFKAIQKIIMNGGVIGFVSPYISDFKLWGNYKGLKMEGDKYYLPELFVSGTLEEDGRIIIITDNKSKERVYSKKIIKQIQTRKDAIWIYLFEIKNLHAKLFLNPREGVVGSSNLTYRALKNNIELGTLISNINEVNDLKKFIGNLFVNSKPINKMAKKLIKNLTKEKLFKENIIFDVMDLVAHSEYLHRTAEIMSFQYSFPKPFVLEKIGLLLRRIDTAPIRGTEIIAKTYRINACSGEDREYWQEEFNIKIKKIKDVLKIWDKYYSGKILQPIDIRKFYKNYKNSYKPPSNLITLKYNQKKTFRAVAECIEDRIKRGKF